MQKLRDRHRMAVAPPERPQGRILRPKNPALIHPMSPLEILIVAVVILFVVGLAYTLAP